MMKEQLTEKGIVIEALPNTQFKIQTDAGKEIRAYLSGKMKMHRIKVSVGDSVSFVVDTQGNNNRIIRRY